MSDLHGERFREMIDDLDDGRIEVMLEFIPVEERLPDNFREFYDVLEYGAWYKLRAQFDGELWYDSNCDEVDVTHWAEVPVIKEVKP